MTLYALYLFAALNHALKTGTNVTVLLFALSLHASPVVVGILASIGSVLPTLFAVSIGRLNDRFGARLPLFAGAATVILSSMLPALWPGLPALFLTAILTGIGSTAFQVSTQNVVGLFGGPEDRARNFSWLAMGFSSGAIVGPMLAGPIIDHAGHSSALVVLAFLPLPALIVSGGGWLALPAPRAKPAGSSRSGGALDLLRDRKLRTVYLLTGLHVAAWEVFSFLVPVYGASIGLDATSIGVILGAFAAATFLVRLVGPYFASRFTALKVIRASLVIAAALFTAFPMIEQVPLLVALAFCVGMDLCITQPLAMALLHESAPPGRTGEAVGLRTAVVNLSAACMPTVYGALGTALGLLPVFWGIAAAVWVAVWAIG